MDGWMLRFEGFNSTELNWTTRRLGLFCFGGFCSVRFGFASGMDGLGWPILGILLAALLDMTERAA
jgi:hypothetical protein